MVATAETVSEAKLCGSRPGISVSSPDPLVKKIGSMNSELGIWNTLIHKRRWR